jgi:acyl-CoA reductase-like NAD-dependent aldehyde dehydrogenase
LLSWDHVEASGKALEQVGTLPEDEQDAIASQILASLADEQAWKARFAEKRDVLRRMALEALEEDARGKTLPLSDLL